MQIPTKPHLLNIRILWGAVSKLNNKILGFWVGQQIEGIKVLAAVYEGNRVDKEIDLDMYQMLDLCMDAKAKLQNVQPNNGLNELVNNENPLDNNVSDDDMESDVHQLREEEFMGLVANRKVKTKEWVDSLIIIPQSQHMLGEEHGQFTLSPYEQPIISPQRGLHCYDLKSLSQPCGATEYEDSNGGEEGDMGENEVSNSVEDLYEDSDFDELGEEDDEEGDAVSLTDSDEMSGLSVNKMATHPWIAEQLLTDYKANPALKVVNM
ncbi:hypothetical protein Cgig2_002555 [Carnegiea gigantea]|uniref:Uncharacterized protein n=1 Tax=Carnegiea gigantea TaxID=171969 RepID=A0A9Q1JJI6_9CARY|nr:hypothetical protein Cgig2_002555 [Carnegiea gigantea]